MENLSLSHVGCQNIAETIKQRRTIHSFQDTEVSEDIILKAIEMGLWAPNHKLTHPMRFFRLGKRGREQVLDLAIKINQKKYKLDFNEVKIEAIKKQYSQCPEILVLGCRKAHDMIQQKEDFATLACGVQNMSLYLWEQGIGCKWSTGAVTKDPNLYDIIGTSPEEIILEGFLWIGYAEKVPRASSRPSLTDVYMRTV